MTSPIHGFSTPLARDLIGMGYEWITEAHPCGHLHNFSGRPVTLPSAHQAHVQEEIQRLNQLHKHEYRGRPGEI